MVIAPEVGGGAGSVKAGTMSARGILEALKLKTQNDIR